MSKIISPALQASNRSCRSPRRRWLAALATLTLIFAPGLAAAGPVAQSAPTLHWMRTTNGCASHAAVQIDCGAIGRYHLDTETIDSPACGPTELTMTEPIVSYPRPGTAFGSDWPCRDGSCFDTKGNGGESSHSVAVIDWDDPHGWSVGAVIAEVAGPASFYALDEPWPELPQILATAGDHHVLRQLCRILETPLPERPRFLNMSFGRFGASGADRCSGGTLACEIDAALQRLAADGAVTFAAAGNDGELLFPASSPAVHAVGSLDLAEYRTDGKVGPTPETPDLVDVLMPGHGLVLSLDDGGTWGAPPGSSYASALATAWIADYARSQFTELVLPWEDGVLSVFDSGDEVYALRFAGSDPLPNSHRLAAAAVACNALGCSQEVSTAAPELPSERRVALHGLGQLPAATFGDVARDGRNRPNPGSRPCIPCHDLPDDLLNRELTTKTLDRLGRSALEETRHEHLAIDLSSSEGLPEEYELRGIYLLVGDMVHAFSDSTHEELLADLAVGAVETLVVLAPPAGVWTRHTALVWVLETDDGTEFWHATPVAIHGH